MLIMTTIIFTTQQTGAAFFGAEKMGSPPYQLLLDHPCKPMTHHLPLFLKEIRSSFKSLIHVLAYADIFLLLLLPQQARHRIGGKMVHVKIVFENTLNWPQLNSQCICNFKNSDLSVLKVSSVTRSTFSSVLLVDGGPSMQNFEQQSHHF